MCLPDHAGLEYCFFKSRLLYHFDEGPSVQTRLELSLRKAHIFGGMLILHLSSPPANAHRLFKRQLIELGAL